MVPRNRKKCEGKTPEFDRRKYPRYLLEIPLDYTDGTSRTVMTGLTGNASEGGIMTFMGERVDVGAVLNVTLMFRLGFSLTSVDTKSMVVWRDDVWKEYVSNYRYGLRFLETEPMVLEKLRELFKTLERQEMLYLPDRIFSSRQGGSS